MIRFVIPGEPHAQQRHRVCVVQLPGRKAFAQTYDPKESKTWKATAQDYMRVAMRDAGATLIARPTPVRVSILAVFALPASKHRKNAIPRGWKTGTKDCDNIAKAVLDAANAVVFEDDSQVAELVVRRVVGAQGEPARVAVKFEAIAGEQPTDLWPEVEDAPEATPEQLERWKAGA